jgi:hypothetical protein
VDENARAEEHGAEDMEVWASAVSRPVTAALPLRIRGGILSVWCVAWMN